MKTKDSILYIILNLLRVALKIAPLDISLYAGRKSGLIAYYIMRQRRGITVNNLRIAFPEKDFSWCSDIAKKVFENFGRNFVEFIKFSSGRLRVSIEGLERVKNGILLMMGHLGNWEITGMSVTAGGTELYSIARAIHNKAVNRFIDNLRTTFGGGVISHSGAMRKVVKSIKSGQNICILIDQRITNGLPVRFFNRPVWGTYAVSLLSRKTAVKVIPGLSYHKNGRLKVFYEEPLDFVSDNEPLKSDFINTQRQFAWLEKKIKAMPDEWFWLHNFWKDTWPCVFLDRDGTINEDHGYIDKKENLKFIAGVMDAMRRLRKAGYLLVIVTNQSGIARGYYTQRDYEKLNDYFLSILESEGVLIDRVYHCHHHPDDGCFCRKPSGGMVLRAQKELNINLKRSFVIGDKQSDISLGRNLGIKTIMVMTGEGQKQLSQSSPDYTAPDLSAAADIILNRDRHHLIC